MSNLPEESEAVHFVRDQAFRVLRCDGCNALKTPPMDYEKYVREGLNGWFRIAVFPLKPAAIHGGQPMSYALSQGFTVSDEACEGKHGPARYCWLDVCPDCLAKAPQVQAAVAAFALGEKKGQP